MNYTKENNNSKQINFCYSYTHIIKKKTKKQKNTQKKPENNKTNLFFFKLSTSSPKHIFYY